MHPQRTNTSVPGSAGPSVDSPSSTLGFAHADALQVAKQLVTILEPGCLKLKIVGSLRRLRPVVKDIELLLIPTVKVGRRTDDFLAIDHIDEADLILTGLLQTGVLARRKNRLGREMWGRQNKYAIHVASGIPVDLFWTDKDRWANMLVCRTGGKETNKRIATEALRRGWRWTACGIGFEHKQDPRKIHRVNSEVDVFDFVGMEFHKPEERD